MFNKHAIGFLGIFGLIIHTQAQTFTNPILPGGYPDPSICYADGVYYMVNSTFEYFPGLPVHKSNDLVNWELIGHALHRKDQVLSDVNLRDVQSDGGIHAPTLRYHDGVFYLITTNVYYHEAEKFTDFVNFILTAEDPAGPWSQPHVLEGAPGIDPDIFFDTDGRVWYVGTHSPENPSFPGEGEIWMQEIDLSSWSLIGSRHFLWRGACGGVWVEGPHLYKRGDMYYLMVAEGGTSYNHAVMIAASQKIQGPYIPNDRNPIFTSRHLSYDHWAHSTGHADLLELPDDRWYMVMLGIRGDEQRGSNMGRETFLAPVVWEKEPFWWKEPKYEWPVVSPETGKIERVYDVPFPNSLQVKNHAFRDDFNSKALNLRWNFRRVPTDDIYSLSENKGHLRLYTQPAHIRERGSSSLMGFRQTESYFSYETSLNVELNTATSEGGIALFQKDNCYVTFGLSNNGDAYTLTLTQVSPSSSLNVLATSSIEQSSGQIRLKVISNEEGYSYFYATEGSDFTLVMTTDSDLLLSESYTGTYLGIYTTSNGKPSTDYIDVDWVDYQARDKP